MNLTFLSEDELFRLASNQHKTIEEINREWLKRYKIQFPYQLIEGTIYNTILKKYYCDSESDKMIVKQARIARATEQGLVEQ